VSAHLFNQRDFGTTAHWQQLQLDTQSVWKLIDRSRLIDQSIKGLSKANLWIELGLLLPQLSVAKSSAGKHRVVRRISLSLFALIEARYWHPFLEKFEKETWPLRFLLAKAASV
jgi:hypothetical protein|tara:strand:+ start:599 stop:940 length:342 start_codon:yes stop_codon:yes gene_type:complete